MFRFIYIRCRLFFPVHESLETQKQLDNCLNKHKERERIQSLYSEGKISEFQVKKHQLECFSIAEFQFIKLKIPDQPGPQVQYG